MAPPNLTRTDAAAARRAAGRRRYTVELDLTDGAGAPGETTFATTTTVRFTCREPGADSWIDFVGADGRTRPRSTAPRSTSSAYREDDGITLPDLAAENELVVVAAGRYMNTGEGLHRFVDPVDGAVYLYSQFETADAKRMFACFDQPDLKATLHPHGHRARRLEGRLQRRPPTVEPRPGRPRCTASRPPRP